VFYGVGAGIRVDQTGDPGTESPAGTIWASTRQDNPTLIRLVPGANPETDAASWTAWPLYGGPFNAQGIVITPDDQVFVQTELGVVRLEPANHQITTWSGTGGNSDLALGPSGEVWRAAPFGPLQRLTTSLASSDAYVWEWNVGGSGEIALAGIAVHPASGLVYFSDNGGDVIGELDPSTHRVRRWSTSAVGAQRPRNLSIDRAGDVWAVTRTNHIIRLRPSTSELTSFLIPSAGSNPYGITADGLVAFTEMSLGKIGFLVPTGSPLVVTPAVDTVMPSMYGSRGWMETAQPLTGTAMPVVADVATTTVDDEGSGYFIEASIPGSAGALGIDRNPADPPGVFYFADYGHRVIGRVSLPLPEKALVTGGGWIDVAGGRASFGFSAFRPESGGSVKGQLRYRNHATGETLESLELTDLLVYGTTATLTGTMDIGGGAMGTFTVQVSDQGEPGDLDTLRITATPGPTAGNTLGGGNIQIHRKD
jgi:streptogramin lyase